MVNTGALVVLTGVLAPVLIAITGAFVPVLVSSTGAKHRCKAPVLALRTGACEGHYRNICIFFHI